jgi:hypothetical protein
MNLSPRERAALSEMESQLIRCDPKLAAMFTQWTVRCARLRAALAALKRRAVYGEHARLVWTTVGLALVIGLSIAGALSTHYGGRLAAGSGPSAGCSRPASVREPRIRLPGTATRIRARPSPLPS